MKFIYLLSALIISTAAYAGTPTPSKELVQRISNPNRINTAGWADSPYMTPDGKELYFMYTPYNIMPIFFGGTPKKIGPDRPGHHSGKDFWKDSDIYVSTRQANGTWSAPKNLPFNDENADACPMLTIDGKAMYYQKDLDGQADIYVVRKNGNGWGKPQRLNANVNDPKANETNPHITVDEKLLFFSSNRKGGLGDMDIYVSFRQPDGSWGRAKNLGAPFSSKEMDDVVWFNPEGTKGYFVRSHTIMQVDKKGDWWSEAKPVEFEGGSLKASEPSITRDGKRMMLALPDFENGLIYAAESTLLPNGKWSKPKPID